MISRLLLFKFNFKKLLLFVVPYVFVIIILAQGFNLVITDDKQWIPRSIVYCDKNPDCISYAKDNGLIYQSSPSLVGDEFIMSGEVIFSYPIKEMNYSDEATSSLIERNMQLMNSDNKTSVESSYRFNLYPSLINQVKIPNNPLDVDYIIDGNYPQSTIEVLIPEYFAQIMIDLSEYDNYHKLIGQNIDGITGNYDNLVISGIYAGGYDFILYPPDSVLGVAKDDFTSCFVKFSNLNQRLKFFDTFHKSDVVDIFDSSLTLIIYKYVYPLIKLLLILVGAITIYKIMSYDIWVLNFYHYKMSNYIIPMLIPLIIILLLTYCIWRLRSSFFMPKMSPFNIFTTFCKLR